MNQLFAGFTTEVNVVKDSTVQFIYSGMLSLYLILILVCLPYLFAKVVQFIANIFLHMKHMHVKIGTIQISLMHMNVHVQQFLLLTENFSFQIQDLLVHYRSLKNVAMSTPALFMQHILQGLNGEKKYEHPTCPLIVEFTGVQFHFFNRTELTIKQVK